LVRLRMPAGLARRAGVSPMCYVCRTSFFAIGPVLILLRFGTSTLYRTGATMGEAELALGVNVVD
jgi:hypothetical protein